MISSGMISGIFEIVLHNMNRKEADKSIKALNRFYTAGWEEILGIQLLHDGE